jgi:CRP-like cAMP-binding protein
VQAGAIGREFFVIVDGQVDVVRNGRPVRRSGGDEFFGEIALLEDVPRTAPSSPRRRCERSY